VKTPSHIRELRKVIEREGITFVGFEITRGGHIRITARKGDAVAKFITPNSPSDHRATQNSISFIRRTFRAAS
jgi:hypothetical protein